MVSGLKPFFVIVSKLRRDVIVYLLQLSFSRVRVRKSHKEHRKSERGLLGLCGLPLCNANENGGYNVVK